ncbi:MAG TPA: VOC family protein [Candidatus Angelobacter sp.]|nr:VOC family protein [Candidatus Angelobacter sp.]
MVIGAIENPCTARLQLPIYQITQLPNLCHDLQFLNLIIGLHAILYVKDADKVRAFLRDVLGLKSVDAGYGWPIFAAPPAEIAAHPTEAAEEPHHHSI